MSRPTTGDDAVLAERTAPPRRETGCRPLVTADVPVDIRELTDQARRCVALILDIDPAALDQGLAQILGYLQAAPGADPTGYRQDAREVIGTARILSAIRACQAQLMAISTGSAAGR